MNFLQTYNADENVEAMKLKNEPDNEKDNEEVRFAKSFIKTKNIIKTDLINLQNQKNLRENDLFFFAECNAFANLKTGDCKKNLCGLCVKNQKSRK